MNALKMKAVVCTQYGKPEHLRIEERAIPELRPNEVLVAVKATTVTAADTMMRRADPAISRLFLGFAKPKNDIMGTGYAGTVVAVGDQVALFHEGDEVFGESGVKFGANAEYIAIAEDEVIAHKPKNISFEEAATICDGVLTSYNFLREQIKIKKGDHILINGASGSLGTAAVQIAKHFGATVTGICGPDNMELVFSLGADQVINYRETDFTTLDERYDYVYDAVGKSSFQQAKKVLKPEGVYLSPVLKLSLLFQMMKTSVAGKQKAMFSATGLQPAPALRALLDEIVVLLEADIIRPIIDRQYTLSEVPEAHRYVDAGHKRGNVVVMV
jgi:NADPH:quinone reductase-like Zn-dependent oxidoreductase